MIPLLLTVAALTIGHPVTLDCKTPAAWANDQYAGTNSGYTLFQADAPMGYTALSPKTCGALVLLSLDPQSRQKPDPAMPDWQRTNLAQAEAFAVLTLGHELTHLEGVRDEAQANCGGLAKMPSLLHQLGASARLDEFTSLAKRQIGQEPAEYQGAC